MKKLFYNFERILYFLLIFCFSFLLIIQFRNYGNRGSINTSILKDARFNYESNYLSIEKGILILKNISKQYKDIKVLINGNVVADFNDSDEIEITVYNNDVVEIDGSTYDDKVSIKIIGVSENISSPELDKIVTTSKSIEILGKVKIK